MNKNEKPKTIKDAVHGYIEIENLFISVINSPEFQRLKFVEQGSFRVLYLAARHDRFIHSLGVYHLARLFSKNLIDNIRIDLPDLKFNENEIKKYQNTFHYAALLHDIGHAPFSHTTEKFFEQSKLSDGKRKIDDDLINAVNSYIDASNEIETDKQKQEEKFCKDYASSMQKPKPHEIISATILLNESDKLLAERIVEIDCEFAARMIIGCTYDYNNCEEEMLDNFGIKNCFIRLLNSDTMDVDKLDYITRDAFMTGFKNVSVDIVRLSKSVTAIKNGDGCIYPAFRKNSISVIDNVFRAKKEHSNWVLSHPTVLYESELLKRAVYDLWGSDEIEKIFSIESLGRTKNQNDYFLFSDSDIIPKMKEKVDFSGENIYNEIFDRSKRRKPIWKSYYEYKMLFGVEKDKELFALFKPLIDILSNKYFVLNKTSYTSIKNDDNIDDKAKSLADVLNNFAKGNGLKFSFAIINAKNQLELKFNPERIFFKFEKCANKGYVAYSELIKKDTQESDDDYFYFYSEDKITEKVLDDLKKRINELIKQNKDAMRA